MIDHHARHHKQRLYRPLVRMLGGVPAWAVTLTGFGAGMLAIAAAFQGAALVALALWMVNRILDGLDGELARAWKRRSDLGGYLDLLADFVVYAFLPIALAASNPAPGVWLTLAAMLAAFYLNAGAWLSKLALMEKRTLAPRTCSHVTSVAIPSGLVEGMETFVLFVLFLLVPSQLPLLFGLTAGLVAVTAIQRVIWASRALHQPAGETRDAPTEQAAPRAASPRGQGRPFAGGRDGPRNSPRERASPSGLSPSRRRFGQGVVGGNSSPALSALPAWSMVVARVSPASSIATSRREVVAAKPSTLATVRTMSPSCAPAVAAVTTSISAAIARRTRWMGEATWGAAGVRFRVIPVMGASYACVASGAPSGVTSLVRAPS